jgi:hypothetical protein
MGVPFRYTIHPETDCFNSLTAKAASVYVVIRNLLVRSYDRLFLILLVFFTFNLIYDTIEVFLPEVINNIWSL